MKQSMTVQELCDKLTVLCHEGHAQAQVRHVTGYEVKAITDVEMVGDEIALITSREEFCYNIGCGKCTNDCEFAGREMK